jgi:putative (di)nucleoside polyphosphate hydrolase
MQSSTAASIARPLSAPADALSLSDQPTRHHASSRRAPQGGIEGDEEAVDALWRELREETGLTAADVQVLAELPEWLGYELPAEYRSAKTGRGQVHKWFVLRASTEVVPVRTDTTSEVEFRSWRWIDLAELAERAVTFRRPVYRRLAELAGGLR